VIIRVSFNENNATWKCSRDIRQKTKVEKNQPRYSARTRQLNAIRIVRFILAKLRWKKEKERFHHRFGTEQPSNQSFFNVSKLAVSVEEETRAKAECKRHMFLITFRNIPRFRCTCRIRAVRHLGITYVIMNAPEVPSINNAMTENRPFSSSLSLSQDYSVRETNYA